MAKVLVIPDTHARDFWKEAIKMVDNYDKVIFLGDYLDPYPYEFNLSRDELREKTINDFKAIIDFAMANIDKVVLLDGNHLLHYLDPDYACSRFDKKVYVEIFDILYQHKALFKPAYQIDDVLFTHAGVSQEWVNYVSETSEIKYTGNIVKFIYSCSFRQRMMISDYRGGRDRYSGPEWLDVHEFDYLTLLPGYYQIFGHTQVHHIGQPWKGENFVCVDTQTIYELDTKTHELKLLQEIPKYNW